MRSIRGAFRAPYYYSRGRSTPVPGPVGLVTNVGGAGGPFNGFSLPPSLKAQTKSPLASFNPSRLPPAAMATYCSPPDSQVAAGASAPKPVWKRQSSSPVFESKARKYPSEPPWNSRPPPVARTPLPNPARYGTSFCHTCLLVRESSAVIKPYSRVPGTDTLPVGLNLRVETPVVKNR